MTKIEILFDNGTSNISTKFFIVLVALAIKSFTGSNNSISALFLT